MLPTVPSSCPGVGLSPATSPMDLSCDERTQNRSLQLHNQCGRDSRYTLCLCRVRTYAESFDTQPSFTKTTGQAAGNCRLPDQTDLSFLCVLDTLAEYLPPLLCVRFIGSGSGRYHSFELTHESRVLWYWNTCR